jgi:hypothetical protein
MNSKKHVYYFKVKESVLVEAPDTDDKTAFDIDCDQTWHEIEEARQIKQKHVQEQIEKTDYVPWLRKLGIDTHLQGLERSAIKLSYQKPYEGDRYGTAQTHLHLENLVTTVLERLTELHELTKSGPKRRLSSGRYMHCLLCASD